MTKALGLLGFGGLDESDASWENVQDVGLVLIVAVVASRLISVVPGKNAATDGIIGSSVPSVIK